MMRPDRLPPAHPNFVARFQAAIYDTDRVENDEQLPFGTDDGADMVWDWAQRSEELEADPRLAVVLGGDIRGRAAEAEDDEEAAEHIVSAGFTVLRYTGTLDPKGRRVVLTVLRRLRDDTSDRGYETMYDDLLALGTESGVAPARKRRRSKPWLILDGGWNDPPHARWLKQLARSIMADPGWNHWWAAADAERLTLTPRPVGPQGGYVEVTRAGNAVRVIASSAALTESFMSLEASGWKPNEDDGIHTWTADSADLFRWLILNMFRDAADHLQMPPPPSALPLTAS